MYAYLPQRNRCKQKDTGWFLIVIEGELLVKLAET